MSYKCIGLLGDSIGQGYFSDNNDGWFGKLIALLNKDNLRAYSSHNMAVSGERITDAFHRFHMEAMTKDLDVLFIAIGINDTIRWDSIETQTDISDGLRDEMWGRLLPAAKKNMDKVFIVSLLPIIESRYPSKGWADRPLCRLGSDVEKYNAFLKKICLEKGIQFVDVTKVWLENNPEKLLFDSGHPNEKGHQLIAEEVYKQVKNKI